LAQQYAHPIKRSGSSPDIDAAGKQTAPGLTGSQRKYIVFLAEFMGRLGCWRRIIKADVFVAPSRFLLAERT
jgi:hypothetical protein